MRRSLHAQRDYRRRPLTESLLSLSRAGAIIGRKSGRARKGDLVATTMQLSTVGSYRIVRLLGEGGMGAVYEAIHQQIGRRAAIKLLRSEHSHNKELLGRFFNEARAVNIVQHPSLVNIYEFGQTPEGAAYIVMEYLEGESLRSRLRRSGGCLGIKSVSITRQIATALAATHAKRITHRDLKPDNVMIVPDPEVGGGERVKVLDFGIAKLAGEPGPGAAGVRTRTGTIMGTPTYMAPEQCRGNAVIEEHADVYALGVMLFEMVAGQPPFQSDAFGELVAMHLFTPPPSLRTFASDAPTELVELVERMLAKAALERPSMDEVAQRLEQLAARPNAGFGAIEAHQLPSNPLALAPTTMRYATSQPSTPARRRWPLALAALLGTSGAAGGLLLWRTQAPSAVAPLRQQDPIPATTSSARAPSPIVEALRGQTAPAPRAASALAAEEASRLHRTCVESTNAGRYKAAVTACQAALRHTPQSSEVRALLRRAETALLRKPVPPPAAPTEVPAPRPLEFRKPRLLD